MSARGCGPFSATLGATLADQKRPRPPEEGARLAPTGGFHGRVASRYRGRIWTRPLPAGDQAVPDAGAAGGIHARQALARAWGPRGGAQAGDFASAARGQDRHGLSRLWPADW